MSPIQDFGQFKNDLARIIPLMNVIEDTQKIEDYAHDHSFSDGSSPYLMVYPENLNDAQNIVKLAFQHKVPLIPVSSGSPGFHGDTVPEQKGVIINFSKMKRIIKIDPVNRCVMLEPGVTYGELVPELKKHGLKLISPLLPRTTKSVVTSALEREPRTVPKYQYDYLDPVLTAEVIYGTGDVFRTGSASGPGNLENLKSDRVNPWGPGQIDYIRFLSGAQGTMGLVTWLNIKVEVLPTLQKMYSVSSDSIKPLVDIMNLMLRRRVGDECLILNKTCLATILVEDWPADYFELKNSLPDWILLVAISGYQRLPEERIRLQEKSLQEICDSMQLKSLNSLPGANGREQSLLNLLSEPWGKQPYWKLRQKNSCRDLFFLSPFSSISGLTTTMKEITLKHQYALDDICCYIQPMVQGRGCHVEFIIPCDESNAKEMVSVKDLFTDASKTLFEHGAFFSRPYGSWAKMVYQNRTSEVAELNKLKNIFDPAGILNPGKLCF